MLKFNVNTKPADYQRDYRDREANIRSEVDGHVLYDLYENGRKTIESCYRSVAAFNRDYR